MSQRQISLPAVIFKGSGFYSTDNRKSGRSHHSGEYNGESHSPNGDQGHSHDSAPKVEAATE